MKRKLLLKTALSVACVAAGMASAQASLEMLTLSDGAGDTVTVKDSDGALSSAGTGTYTLWSVASGTAGVVTWSGSLGNWTVSVDTGETKPAIGSATNPQLDLNFLATSSAAASLTITWSDTDFGPMGKSGLALLNTGGTLASGATLTASGQVNGSTVISAAPFSTSSFGSSTMDAVDLPLSSFTLGETMTLTQNAAGGSSGDIDLHVAVPEPTTMIAGALLLLPFGASTLRILRKKLVA